MTVFVIFTLSALLLAYIVIAYLGGKSDDEKK